MKWNWQLAKWPSFSFNNNNLSGFEQRFFSLSGAAFGIFKCLDASEQDQLRVQLLSEEAMNTSAIEGEYLNRESLQSSICRELGLTTQKSHITLAEENIVKMMLDVYWHYSDTLTDDTLFAWHEVLTRGRTDLEKKGAYRTHSDPMLIVSGGKREPTIHFEAPPSEQVAGKMQKFIEWFNDTEANGKNPLPVLVRAGIAHLYFESIHPFEDGNGRIGRAIVEKALSQSLGQPTLISLSYVIEKNKKAYYAALQKTNHSLDITDWLIYFSETVLSAQEHTQKQIELLIKKTKFFDKFGLKLNERQRKVLLRMFKEGVDGFDGGLSAENYIAITKTSRATATRDLQALVLLGALMKKGELKYTRYYLKLT